MQEILVSISCITYNHEEYIRDALESFLMQKTKFKYEILVHDDASTDGTAEIIRQYAKKYPSIIKPIIQKENQLSKGVRRMLYRYNHTRALGNYISICEGDDYWIDPNKLQKQIDYMENNLSCSMSFHSALIVNSNKRVVDEIRPYQSSRVISTEDIIRGGGGFCPTQSITYRKNALENPPSFFYDAPVGDYPMQLLLAYYGQVYYLDDKMSAYRRVTKKGGSWSSRNKSNVCKIELIDGINEMLNEFNAYTKYEYNYSVLASIKKREIFKLAYQREYKKIKSSEYADIYRNLSYNEKFRMYAMTMFPSLYNTIVDYKYR